MSLKADMRKVGDKEGMESEGVASYWMNISLEVPGGVNITKLYIEGMTPQTQYWGIIQEFFSTLDEKKVWPSNITISKESSIFQKIAQNIAFWDTSSRGW